MQTMEKINQKLRRYISITIFMLLINKRSAAVSLSPNLTTLNFATLNISCIEYSQLNPLKNLTEIVGRKRYMDFFPNKNCSNNSSSGFDTRPLDLPHLTKLDIWGNELTIMPDFSLMPELTYLDIGANQFNVTLMGFQNPFTANKKLVHLDIRSCRLTVLPSITGSCSELKLLLLQENWLTSLPPDYFVGCNKLESINFRTNRLAAFPNFSPVGPSLQEVLLKTNKIPGVINSDMLKNLTSLSMLELSDNLLQSFEASLCHIAQSIEITTWPNDEMTCKDPYRSCPNLPGTFSPPTRMTLGRTMKCDPQHCWIKKAPITFNDIPCIDGRKWSEVPRAEVCPISGLQMNVVNRQGDRSMFQFGESTSSILEMASKNRTMASERPCAFWCFQTPSCEQFQFHKETGVCVIKYNAA